MKRKEIIGSMPDLDDADKIEEFEGWIKTIIDYFECQFQEIDSLLNIQCVADLGHIEDAKELARNCADDLY